MADFELNMIQNWLRSIIIRIEDLQKDHRLIHINIFKNYGANAGAIQEHPHTQILSLPVMPKEDLEFLQRNKDYYKVHGRGILEDIVENEIDTKKRVIEMFGSFVAFCPYASVYPFEVMIATKAISSLNMCSRKEVGDLAVLIKKVFTILKKQLGQFDYNLYFKLPPLNTNFENEDYIANLQSSYRFSISIIPRIYNFGGFEISTPMAINSVAPEYCATLLREDENN